MGDAKETLESLKRAEQHECVEQRVRWEEMKAANERMEGLAKRRSRVARAQVRHDGVRVTEKKRKERAREEVELEGKIRDGIERELNKRDRVVERKRPRAKAESGEVKEKNRVRAREVHRQKRLAKYGLTEESYDALLSKQGGGCAICGRTPVEEKRSLAIDHCHETHEVRGLLCGRCNMGVGVLETHEQESLVRLLMYLGHCRDVREGMAR